MISELDQAFFGQHLRGCLEGVGKWQTSDYVAPRLHLGTGAGPALNKIAFDEDGYYRMGDVLSADDIPQSGP